MFYCLYLSAASDELSHVQASSETEAVVPKDVSRKTKQKVNKKIHFLESMHSHPMQCTCLKLSDVAIPSAEVTLLLKDLQHNSNGLLLGRNWTVSYRRVVNTVVMCTWAKLCR